MTIIKTKHGYKVISHRTGRNMGTYSTKSDAQRRLHQIKRFSRKGN